MPGRGTPWRGVGKGKQDRIGSGEIEDESITSDDILDGTIQEGDLDTALQSKVNQAGGHVIEDEGSPLSQRPNMNFIGAGVTASDDGETTNVTIPGGGGGGGLFYSSFVMDSLGDYTPFGPSEASFVSSENNNLGGAIMRAGKVTKVWVTVVSASATSTNLTFRKNNATSGTTISWTNTANGTVIKNTEDRTFVIDDQISWRVAGAVTFQATVVVEWDFS